jgi:hypothetical protein
MMLIGIAGGLLAFVFVLAMGSSGGTRGVGGGPWMGGGMGAAASAEGVVEVVGPAAVVVLAAAALRGIGEHVCIAHPSTPADAALGSQPGVSITGSGCH